MGKKYLIEFNDDVQIQDGTDVLLSFKTKQDKTLLGRCFVIQDEEQEMNKQIISLIAQDEDIANEPDLYSRNYGKDSL